ncbi:MAG: ABC transporter permease, partial [Chloroflexi bacterium]|nr:ABC transporter permease [Chloroflexota bacterium]
AIAGIISTSRTGVGSPIVGTGMELDAIAAVVIGGASLSGGRGNAINTLLGVLVLGMIGNIMNLMNVPSYPQQVIQGLIIVAAVLLQGVELGRSR